MRTNPLQSLSNLLTSSRAGHSKLLRAGTTLVELLAVIGVVGVAFAMFIPVLAESRAYARKISCADRMRGVGRAVQYYESHYNALPAAGVVARSVQKDVFNPASGPQFSWMVLILPFMDHTDLASQFNQHRSMLEQRNSPQSIAVPEFLCPSDGGSERMLFSHPRFPETKFAKGNFAAFVSPVHVEHARRIPGALGGFKPNEPLGQRLKKITDGTSKTLLGGEVRTRNNSFDSRGVWALPWAGSSTICGDLHSVSERPNEYVPDRDQPFETIATPNSQTSTDKLYMCTDVGQSISMGMPCSNYTDYLTAATRSHHTGGSNVIFLDGHGAFFTDDVDPVAFAMAIYIADGRSLNNHNDQDDRSVHDNRD